MAHWARQAGSRAWGGSRKRLGELQGIREQDSRVQEASEFIKKGLKCGQSRGGQGL